MSNRGKYYPPDPQRQLDAIKEDRWEADWKRRRDAHLQVMVGKGLCHVCMSWDCGCEIWR